MTENDPLAGTQRELGTPDTPAGEGRSVRLRRRYDSPIEDVWDACTVPDRLNRWFLPVTGDLRVGGAFALQGNAGGEILACEPPRLLTVSWVFGDRPPGQVRLRLSPDGADATVLELEHVNATRLVEVDGRMVDVALNDPISGIWGLGVGWELPLVFGLARYLRGELPDAPAIEWYQPTPEDLAAADRAGAAWAALAPSAR